MIDEKVWLNSITKASDFHFAVTLVMLLELEEAVHIRSLYIINSHSSSGNEKTYHPLPRLITSFMLSLILRYKIFSPQSLHTIHSDHCSSHHPYAKYTLYTQITYPPVSASYASTSHRTSPRGPRYITVSPSYYHRMAIDGLFINELGMVFARVVPSKPQDVFPAPSHM